MSKLALLGGEKAVKQSSGAVASIPLVRERAYETVTDLMRKGQISTSPLVKEFEKRWCEYVGAQYGLCFPNGTTSIQAGLFAVGVGPGDEVIVPSFTFWASAGPIVVNNATPVFCEVDSESHLMTAETIEPLITPKTKAIVVVHVWGTPADMDPIMALAKKYDLKVVEDCSHAHGAKYKGQCVGTIGDVGCFSMQGSKTLAAGEAGILVTNNETYFARACALGQYERLSGLPADCEYRKYSLTGFGYKHRVNPLAIAIADAALDDLSEINALRNKNAKYLEDLIADLDYITVQKVPEGAERLYAYHYVRYNPEALKGLNLNTLLKAIAAEGASCGSCGYGRLHLAPLYTGDGIWGGRQLIYPEGYEKGKALPITEDLAGRAFMLAPRFEKECDEHIQQYAEAYHKVLENVDELVDYEIKNNLRSVKIDNDGRSINIYK